MYPDNPKIQTLLQLGFPENSLNWPNYIDLYGFVDEDTPALLALFTNHYTKPPSLAHTESWAPLHAWRTLGQLKSKAAIEPLIASFDILCNNELALSELGKVLGMIGSKAIEPIASYLQQAGKNEFCYVLAIDALAEIAKANPEYHDTVINIYRHYMNAPITTAKTLNSLLICQLLDLDARETIDDIRRLFKQGCIDVGYVGDIEDIEIEWDLRRERTTSKPITTKLYGIDYTLETDDDDMFQTLDYWLLHHGDNASILGSSELDGYFAAIACSPDNISQSAWMPAIWGDNASPTPQWENEQDAQQFNKAILNLYNQVMFDIKNNVYEPIFMESTITDEPVTIVDDWCTGFMRGLILWNTLSAKDAQQLEEYLQPMQLFATESGFAQLESMTMTEVEEQQLVLSSNVREIHHYFNYSLIEEID